MASDRPTLERIDGLDGLRGIAAVVVMIHHTLLLDPNLAEAHRTQAVGLLPKLLTYTPLHLAWAGAEAVVVFFVLSGFVLARPSLAGGRRLVLRRYLPRRLVRLYVPVWGALVLLLAVRLLRPDAAPGASWWLALHEGPVSWRDVVLDGLLLRSPSFATLPALWSLRWEVAFSLALPAVVWVVRRVPAAGAVAVAIASLAAAFVLGLQGPGIMGAAVLGVLLGREESRLRRSLVGLSPRRGWLLFGLAAVALTAPWTSAPLRWRHPAVDAQLEAVAAVLAVAGAVGFVVLALWRPLDRVLSGRHLTWLGTRSFSLYLVHEPVGVTVAFLLRAESVTPAVVVLSWGLSVAVAAVFFRVVERPSSRWSRRMASPPAVRPAEAAAPC